MPSLSGAVTRHESFASCGASIYGLAPTLVNVERPGIQRLVTQRSEQLKQRIYSVLMWASLPSIAWSPWQRLNLWRMPSLRGRVERQRLRNCRMVTDLVGVLEKVLGGRCHAAFKWPRNSLGWKGTREPKERLRNLLRQ